MKIIGTRTHNAQNEQNAEFINVPVPVPSGYCCSSKASKVTVYPSENCQKVTISIVMFVCPSFCSSVHPSFQMKQLCSNWTNFHEICYMNTFRNSVQKIQVSLKSDKDEGCFT